MELDELTDAAIDHIYANIDTDSLASWQQGFIESTNDQWTRRRWLSNRQKEILGQIWDRQRD